ncbi:hypothetical protein QR680_015368 [Steinernema hermaphroditum]|uniref:RZ-type domain-containing protein n=1 Tax=Steinernema hermaphroditum TaxID=289476 RepID=A0AA39LK41_9BILA|nr:hypothetical protein QR680_015368 [Steinernema hermaphroditum]
MQILWKGKQATFETGQARSRLDFPVAICLSADYPLIFRAFVGCWIALERLDMFSSTTFCLVPPLRIMIPDCVHRCGKKDAGMVRCTAKVKKRWMGCEHEAEVECWVDPAKTRCPHPCGTSLPDCQHICRGTCGACRRGRLHVRCEERCKRVLFCGHACDGMCSAVCPPCEKPCGTACHHSRCGIDPTIGALNRNRKGRKCGERCPPCLERCSNRCEHRACTKRCMYPCDVEPCNARCLEPLWCGHQCLGFCGENCPEICRQCTNGPLRKAYEEASEVFLGREADDGAIFIQLECGHCIESKGMDSWVQLTFGNSAASAIVQLTCPKCKAPLKKSRRYQKHLAQRTHDMEEIKRRLLGGSTDELDGQRAKVVEAFHSFVHNNMRARSKEVAELVAVAITLRALINEPRRTILNKELIANFKSWDRSLEQLWNLWREIDLIEFSKCRHENTREAVVVYFGCEDVTALLVKEWRTLVDYLRNTLATPLASSLMYTQFANELNRLGRTIKIARALYMCDEIGMLADDTLPALGELNRLLNFSTESDGKSVEEFRRLVKVLDGTVAEAYRERSEIRRVLGSAVTSWYKCPNGHLYGIGDCGRAMESARCPECDAEIGGQQHRLREDNAMDREMTSLQRRITGLPMDEDMNPFEVFYE